MKRIKHLPNEILLIFIVSILIIKVIFFGLVKADLLNISLGGGSDADYYDLYAQGYISSAVNVWPVILRSLNESNLYSRDFISYLLLFLNLFILPLLACKLADLNIRSNQKLYFYLFLICLLYPTLYFFTFDIYRDIFMVFSFLIGCLTVKKMLSSKNILLFMFYFLFNMIIGSFLLQLRPYLGYAFILSLFLFNIRFTKKRLFILGALYILALFIAYSIGVLDVLVEYRSGFEPNRHGSTLGLDFTNPVLFLPNLILSTLGQLFGLYITNPFAAILLLIETIPFVAMLFYIIKNIKLADSFARFLIIFFVLYASVWLIGNDNLGTAVRLRLYNYFAVYICFFYILRLKQLMTSNNMQAKQ